MITLTKIEEIRNYLHFNGSDSCERIVKAIVVDGLAFLTWCDSGSHYDFKTWTGEIIYRKDSRKEGGQKGRAVYSLSTMKSPLWNIRFKPRYRKKRITRYPWGENSDQKLVLVLRLKRFVVQIKQSLILQWIFCIALQIFQIPNKLPNFSRRKLPATFFVWYMLLEFSFQTVFIFTASTAFWKSLNLAIHFTTLAVQLIQFWCMRYYFNLTKEKCE